MDLQSLHIPGLMDLLGGQTPGINAERKRAVAHRGFGEGVHLTVEHPEAARPTREAIAVRLAHRDEDDHVIRGAVLVRVYANQQRTTSQRSDEAGIEDGGVLTVSSGIHQRFGWVSRVLE